MNSVAGLVGGLLSAVVYTIFFAAAYKIFTMSNELKEIKDLLKEMKRSGPAPLDPFSSANLPQPIGTWTVLDEK
jgi:hypothetical protein